MEITSGGVLSGSIGNAAVVSGSIASGAISRYNIASGAFNSGHFAIGSIKGSAVNTGNIASGTLGTFDFGNGAITSGKIASGQIGQSHFASGTITPFTNNIAPLVSGSLWTLNTEETISGGRAVNVSQSGYLRVAMSSLSGRALAVGLVMANVLSGQPASVYVHGCFQHTSGMADYSGYLGRSLIVGRSGQIVTMSGSFNSGGLGTTDRYQRVGMVMNSGGIVANVDSVCWSGAAKFGSVIV